MRLNRVFLQLKYLQMQNLQIIGNIGQDAVIKKNSNSGEEFVTCSVACNESYTNKDGEKVEKTQWYDVIIRRTGISKFLTAGSRIFVSGRPVYSQYVNKQNQTVISVQINADRVEFFSMKKDDAPF